MILRNLLLIAMGAIAALDIVVFSIPGTVEKARKDYKWPINSFWVRTIIIIPVVLTVLPIVALGWDNEINVYFFITTIFIPFYWTLQLFFLESKEIKYRTFDATRWLIYGVLSLILAVLTKAVG